MSWGDVLIDDVLKPTCVQIYLRRSKSDPFGHGVRVYIGSTGTDLCPIQAIVEYTRSRGTQAGPFFVFPDGTPLKKPTFVAEVRKAIQQAGLEAQDYAGHSFCIWGGDSCGTGWHRGFINPNSRTVEQRGILRIHTNSAATVSSCVSPARPASEHVARWSVYKVLVGTRYRY